MDGLAAGDRHYHAYIGPPDQFDIMGALQFNVLTAAGLRAHHTLLDIGCGSLRAGRLLLPYLAPGNYHGLEPNSWLVDEAIQRDLGQEFIDLRRPTFAHNSEFDCTGLNRSSFDYLIAQSVFSHTTATLMRQALQGITAVMGDQSILIATVVLGEADSRHEEDWVYPGIVEFRREAVAQLFDEAGLQTAWPEWAHPRQTWVVASRSRPPDLAAAGHRAELEVLREELARLRAHPVVKGLQRLRSLVGSRR